MTKTKEHNEGSQELELWGLWGPNSPNEAEQDICHNFGCFDYGAVWLVESPGIVFNVSYLPHQGRDSPEKYTKFKAWDGEEGVCYFSSTFSRILQ